MNPLTKYLFLMMLFDVELVFYNSTPVILIKLKVLVDNILLLTFLPFSYNNLDKTSDRLIQLLELNLTYIALQD